MKKILMMILPSCPHCHKALSLMEQLKKEHPEYSDIDVEIVDERAEAERADALDYYYVPTYFVDGVKIHEGVPSLEKVENVFKAALLTDKETTTV